jgi:hypothetical protein
MRSGFNYNQSKTRIFASDHAQALDDVVVIGRDASGQPFAWSTLDEKGTRALIEQHGLKTPESVG